MIDKDYQLNINWCAENTAQLIAEERQYRKRIPSKQAIIADIMPYSLHQDKHFSGFVFCSAQNGIRSRTHGPASDLWCQGDNRETYTRLLGELGDSWYYKDKSIVYNINDYGYRAPKFSDVVLWKKTIPVFGCSMVYGIGLAEEHRFSNILEQTTNRKTIILNFDKTAFTYFAYYWANIGQIFISLFNAKNSSWEKKESVLGIIVGTFK